MGADPRGDRRRVLRRPDQLRAENELYHEDYVKLHTNGSFIVSKDFEFNDGLFSRLRRGHPHLRPDVVGLRDRGPVDRGRGPPGAGRGAKATAGLDDRQARRDAAGPAQRVPAPEAHFTATHPRWCRRSPAFRRRSSSRSPRSFAPPARADKVGNVVYAVGLTHHTTGGQMIRGIAVLQLLLGNVGRPGGGVNAERGHANIQGNTDNASRGRSSLGTWHPEGARRPSTPTSRRGHAEHASNALNFFGSMYRPFMVSLLKTWFGDHATKENDYGYQWLPKPDKNWSWMTIHDEALAGRLHGLFNGGMSSVNIGPDSNRIIKSLSALKWFVVMDPSPTDRLASSGAPPASNPPRSTPRSSSCPPRTGSRSRRVRQLRSLGSVEARGPSRRGRDQGRQLDRQPALPAAQGALRG